MARCDTVSLVFIATNKQYLLYKSGLDSIMNVFACLAQNIIGTALLVGVVFLLAIRYDVEFVLKAPLSHLYTLTTNKKPLCLQSAR